MGKSLQLDIVTPDKMVLSRRVDYVSACGAEGEFGVLPGHIPFLAALKIGVLAYMAEGRRRGVFIGGGFAEISNDKVTILAESSELAEDIDASRADEARKRAEERLRLQAEGLEFDRARAALQRALVRLNLSGHPS